MTVLLAALLYSGFAVTAAQEDCKLELPLAVDPPLDSDPLISHGYVFSDSVRDIVSIDGFAFELSTGTSNTDSNDNFYGFPVQILGVGAIKRPFEFQTANGFMSPIPAPGNIWNYFPDRSRDPWLPKKQDYECSEDWGRAPEETVGTWLMKASMASNLGRMIPTINHLTGGFDYVKLGGKLASSIMPPWFVDMMVREFNVPATLFVLPRKYQGRAYYEGFYGINPADGSVVDPDFVPSFDANTLTFTSFTGGHDQYRNLEPQTTRGVPQRRPHFEYVALMRWIDRYPIQDVSKEYFLRAVNASIKLGWGDLNDKKTDGSPMWTEAQKQKMREFYDTFIRVYGSSAQQAAEAGGSTFGSAGAQRKRAALIRCDNSIYRFGLTVDNAQRHADDIGNKNLPSLAIGSMEGAMLVNQFIGQRSNKGPWGQRANRVAVNQMHRRFIRKSVCSGCALTWTGYSTHFYGRVAFQQGALPRYREQVFSQTKEAWWQRWLELNFARSPLSANEIWGKETAALVCENTLEIPAFRQGRLGNLSLQDAVFASHVLKGPVSAQRGMGVLKSVFGTWAFDRRRTRRDVIVSAEIDPASAQRLSVGERRQSIRVQYTGNVVARWLEASNNLDLGNTIGYPYHGRRKGDLYLRLNEDPAPCLQLNQRQPRIAPEQRIVCGNDNPHCLCLIGEAKQGTETPILRLSFNSLELMRKFQQEVQDLFDRLRRRSTFRRHRPAIAEPPLIQQQQQPQPQHQLEAGNDGWILVDSLQLESLDAVTKKAPPEPRRTASSENLIIKPKRKSTKLPADFNEEFIVSRKSVGQQEVGQQVVPPPVPESHTLHEVESVVQHSGSFGSRRSATKILRAGNQQQILKA
jgi:hypothetical protein